MFNKTTNDALTHDVIISGCGPVGATLAVLLGRHGLNVLVLEKFETTFDKPRAIVLDWEVLRLLQFCDVAHDLAPTIVPHTGTDFVGIDGQCIKRFDPLPPPYPLGWPATVMFVQPELERLLRARLAALPSVELKLGARFDALDQCGDRVSVTYTDLATGGEHRATAKYLVGCDGANSAVREQLGIGFDDLDFDEWWIVIDAWQRRDTALPAKTTQYCQPSRPATYVVGPDNLRRWEIKIMPGEKPEDFSDEERLKAVWGAYVDTSAFELWRSATYRFNARVGCKWRQGRVFMAGDAMHQTPPFLGQGLCAGMRDAANLSWKLIRAVASNAADALLDTYEAERLAHVSTIIEYGKAFGLIIGELDEEKARERDRTLRAELLSGRMITSRQGFIPNLTTGILNEDDPLAGTLMVQPRILHGGEPRLLDDVVPMTFLYVAGDDEAQGWADGSAQPLAAMGIARITIGPGGHEEVGAFLRDWAVCNGVRAAFVRPDRYVFGGVRSTADFPAVLASLAAQLEI